MKTLSVILPRRKTPWEHIALLLVQKQQIPNTEEILYDLAAQVGIQIVQITPSLTLTGKIHLHAQLAGNVESTAVVVAGHAIYQQGKIDYLLYQDTEKPCKIWLHGRWRRTWL